MRQEHCISNSSEIAQRLAIPRTPNTAKLVERINKVKNDKTAQKRFVRYGFIATNIAIVAVVAAFVLYKPNSNDLTSTSVLKSATTTESQTNPLDQVSSADIALTVARMSSLPESTAINSQAESEAINAATAMATSSVAAKPQVISAGLKSNKDIQTYKAVEGDSVITLAQKFGVTSSSIRWSNNLLSDSLTAGTVLRIPPVNGIVHKVAAGDTVDSLAQKYSASRDKIAAFNDAEISGLRVGTYVVIPDGTKAAPITATQIARASAPSVAWGSTPIYGYNGYDYGYCTWYVANRIKVPANWGNANTWDNSAPASGWRVSGSAQPGSIGVSNRGYYGHVVYIEAVSADGSQIKYSDMNGLAGFGRVGYSDWVPISKFDSYISR